MTPSNDLTGVERLVRRMNLKLLYENRYQALWDGNITPDLLPRLEAEYMKEFGKQVARSLHSEKIYRKRS